MTKDWMLTAAEEIAKRIARDGDRSDVAIALSVIKKHAPKASTLPEQQPSAQSIKTKPATATASSAVASPVTVAVASHPQQGKE